MHIEFKCVKTEMENALNLFKMPHHIKYKENYSIFMNLMFF